MESSILDLKKSEGAGNRGTHVCYGMVGRIAYDLSLSTGMFIALFEYATCGSRLRRGV